MAITCGLLLRAPLAVEAEKMSGWADNTHEEAVRVVSTLWSSIPALFDTSYSTQVVVSEKSHSGRLRRTVMAGLPRGKEARRDVFFRQTKIVAGSWTRLV